jgi:hypothetical protein
MQRILTLAIFLLIILLSSSYGDTLDLDHKLLFFLVGGQSKPVGDFRGQVKAGISLGGGVEYQFLPNWAIGSSIHKIDFKHKNIWYDPWSSAWTYTDWTFIRANLYGKYIFIRKNFTPYLKLGFGIYFIEDKRTFIGKSQLKSHNDGLSSVPGAGFEYLTEKLRFFVETNYNIITTKHLGGDRLHKQGSQFFDFLIGVGFCLIDL